MFKRFCWYLGGLILLTIGQRLFVEAGFGAGSLDALCVGLSERTALSAGNWVWITGLLMMFASAVLNKERPRFTVLVTSFVFGCFFDLWGYLFHIFIMNQDTLFRILLYILGIILAPLGTAVYFQSEFSKSAFDEFVVAIKDRGKMQIGKAKTIVEIALCISAYLIGGPIGITTFITAILFGPILQNITHHLTKVK